MIEIIRELKTTGKLSELIRGGAMSSRIARDYEIWLEVDKRKRIEHKRSKAAISEVADLFGVCERTVERAVKIFEQ